MLDYPTEEELKTISTWRDDDLHGLMAYIKPRWEFSDCGYWKQDGDIYIISTGGWSGNEEIIGALQENIIFWAIFWYSSTRGGKHIFAPLTMETINKLN